MATETKQAWDPEAAEPALYQAWEEAGPVLPGRDKRMRGFEVLWVPGADDAAIATQNVIEKQLAEEGTTKERLGHAAFEERVERWYADYGGRILTQLRRLGFSADWTRLRFTMD